MNTSNPSDAALAELLTLNVETDCWGTTAYRNAMGQLHRVHGPAIIMAGNIMMWYQNGQRHRTDGPAYVGEWKNRRWYLHDQQLTKGQFNERIRSLR